MITMDKNVNSMKLTHLLPNFSLDLRDPLIYLYFKRINNLSRCTHRKKIIPLPYVNSKLGVLSCASDFCFLLDSVPFLMSYMNNHADKGWLKLDDISSTSMRFTSSNFLFVISMMK